MAESMDFIYPTEALIHLPDEIFSQREPACHKTAEDNKTVAVAHLTLWCD